MRHPTHHDVILSRFTIPTLPTTQPRQLNNIAPKIEHSRTKINWSKDGLLSYCELVAPHLRHAREMWLDPSSQSSMSVLLSITSSILTKCATMTNKFIVMSSKSTTKSKRTPKAIKLAKNKMTKTHNFYKRIAIKDSKHTVAAAKDSFNCSKKKYKQAVKHTRLQESLQRYHRIDDIFANPGSAYAYIRSCRKSKPKKIEKLTVGDKVYMGAGVADGFYDSMTVLNCDDWVQTKTRFLLKVGS